MPPKPVIFLNPQSVTRPKATPQPIKSKAMSALSINKAKTQQPQKTDSKLTSVQRQQSNIQPQSLVAKKISSNQSSLSIASKETASTTNTIKKKYNKFDKKEFPPGTVPVFIPGLRSKYMLFEILSWLFEHMHEVSLFLRSLSQTSQAFLSKFKGELKGPFKPYAINISPPLKFVLCNQTMSGDPNSMSNSMMRKVHGFNALTQMKDFEGQFHLCMDIILDQYDFERDSIDPHMGVATRDILYDPRFFFKELTFTMETFKQVSAFFGMNKESIKEDFLLPYLFGAKEQGDEIRVQKLHFKKIDTFLLNYFIGEAQHRSEQIMAKIKASFWNKLLSTEEKQAEQPDIKIKALKFTSDCITEVEFNQCDLDIEMCNTISKFLTDCASTLEKLIISRVTPGHRGDEELNLTLFKMLTEISPNMNKLTHLDLSYNKIKDESCPDLCNFLLCIPPSLQILNLTGADLKDKGLELLAKEFLGQPESYNLTELDLSSNRISTTNCSKALAQSFRAMDGLLVLKLKRMRLKEHPFRYLAEGFPINLTQLDLSSNLIGDEDVEKLQEKLQKNCSTYGNGISLKLKHLNLAKNEIGKSGLNHVIKIVVMMEWLEQLNIEQQIYLNCMDYVMFQNKLYHQIKYRSHQPKVVWSHADTVQSFQYSKANLEKDYMEEAKKTNLF